MPMLCESSDSKEEMLKETRGQIRLAHVSIVQTQSSTKKMRALLGKEESILGCQNWQYLSKESVHSSGLLHKSRNVVDVRLHGPLQTDVRADTRHRRSISRKRTQAVSRSARRSGTCSVKRQKRTAGIVLFFIRIYTHICSSDNLKVLLIFL